MQFNGDNGPGLGKSVNNYIKHKIKSYACGPNVLEDGVKRSLEERPVLGYLDVPRLAMTEVPRIEDYGHCYALRSVLPTGWCSVLILAGLILF